MSEMSDGTIVTDIDNHEDNNRLTCRGYTIRRIETWHHDGLSETFIVWDAPEITEADLPY